jgi:hypothetical protein
MSVFYDATMPESRGTPNWEQKVCMNIDRTQRKEGPLQPRNNEQSTRQLLANKLEGAAHKLINAIINLPQWYAV